MAATQRNVVFRGMRLLSMSLTMLTLKKELHGFLFLCIHVVLFCIINNYSYGALFGGYFERKLILVELSNLSCQFGRR